MKTKPTKQLIIAVLALASGFACLAQADRSPNSGAATQTQPGGNDARATPSTGNDTAQPQPGLAPGAIPASPSGSGMGGFGGFGASTPQPPRTMSGAPSSGSGGYGGFGGGYGASRNSYAGFSQRLQSIVGRAGGERGTDEPLLVLCSDTDPASQEKLHEDMLVMAHILQKAAGASEGSGYPGHAMGVNLLFGPGGSPGRDFYLEGYGAVFLVNVPFPLARPPGKTEDMTERPAADSDWEKAKRELHGDLPEPAVVGTITEPYREERVAQLKQAILEALKNASNLRELKPNESVTVCVLGPAGGGTASPQPPRSWRLLRTPEDPKLDPGAPPHVNETVLTIRVTKGDAEAFTKGQLDLKEFQKKAKISSYGA